MPPLCHFRNLLSLKKSCSASEMLSLVWSATASPSGELSWGAGLQGGAGEDNSKQEGRGLRKLQTLPGTAQS